MKHLGDFPVAATVCLFWSTNAADGSSITRATNGTIACHVTDSAGTTTRTTVGITDSEDYGSLVGVHRTLVDTSSVSEYPPGSEVAIVLEGAVVDGKTVNAVLGQFSTMREGAILDEWTGSNISNRIPTELIAGRMSSSLGNLEVAGASQIAAAVLDGPMAAHLASDSVGAAIAAGGDGGSAPTASEIADEVETRTIARVGVVEALEANAITAAALAPDAGAEIRTGLATQASVDALPSSAELDARFDTIDTNLGTINANVGTVGGLVNAVGALVEQVKAKTDALPTDPADQSIIANAIAAVQAAVDALALIDAAIKAKTDLLAFTGGRVHADVKAVAGEVLALNGTGGQNIGAAP